MKCTDAILLCGGRGTRLSSVVNDRPKPMADIAGKPFIVHIIEQLQRQGIAHLIISVGYMAEYMQQHLQQYLVGDMRISWVVEDTPLGTGGAVLKSIRQASHFPVLVLNGDCYINVNLTTMLEQHQTHEADITILASEVEDGRDYGTLEVTTDGAITAFNEKSASGPALVNAGVYLMNEYVFDNVNENRFSLEKDYFPRQVSKGLYAAKTKEKFYDIGTPERYAIAEEYFKSQF